MRPEPSRSSHRHERRPLRVLAVLVCLIVTTSGCSNNHASKRSGPSLITADNWTAPVVTGGASPQNFCTLLVAMYEHEAQIPLAANNKIKEQMLQDYVNTTPRTVSEAPPTVARAAGIYLPSVAKLLADLIRVGLDSQKLRGGNLASLLLDPRIKSAGNEVLAYSRSQCHYNISG